MLPLLGACSPLPSEAPGQGYWWLGDQNDVDSTTISTTKRAPIPLPQPKNTEEKTTDEDLMEDEEKKKKKKKKKEEEEEEEDDDVVPFTMPHPPAIAKFWGEHYIGQIYRGVEVGFLQYKVHHTTTWMCVEFSQLLF